MIDSKIQDALNAHIDAELASAQLYLAMSAHCEQKAYKGFGRWLRAQQAEETMHAHKFLDYLLARSGEVALGAQAAPPREFGTLTQTFEAVLAHEREVTARIHALYTLAGELKDTATQVFLQWFVTEQVEEEENASEIVDRLHMVGERPGSALYLDKEYGKRKPAAFAAGT